MARRRMIDPTIWTSTSFLKLNHRQRLLFIGIVSNSDDYGKLSGDLRTLKAKIFPADPMKPSQIESDLKIIENTNNMILRYDIIGESFIKLPKWFVYQRVDKPRESQIPEPYFNDSEINPGLAIDDSVLKEGKLKEGKVKEPDTGNEINSFPLPSGNGSAMEVEMLFKDWNEMANKCECRKMLKTTLSSKHGRYRAAVARLKDPFFRDNYKQALEKVLVSPFCNGDSDRGWKADIDFFLQPDRVMKILEGKHDKDEPLRDQQNLEKEESREQEIKETMKKNREKWGKR